MKSDDELIQEIYNELVIEHDKVKDELDAIKADDKRQLTEMSKKISATLGDEGVDEMVVHMMVERAKIIDHFMLAYMVEEGLKPSELRMIQNHTDEGYEIFFEKRSSIILPG